MTVIFQSKSNLCDIDRLGELRAHIADLTKLADELSDGIKDLGAGRHDGELFSACVVVVEERWSVDSKAVAAKLLDVLGRADFDRFCAAHQKRSAGYTSLKLAARA